MGVEVDADDGGDVDRAAVRDVGTVAPAFDSLYCCSAEQPVAVNPAKSAAKSAVNA